MEEDGRNEVHDCIEWVADGGVVEHVWVHNLERSRIGIGEDQEYTVQAVEQPHYLLLLYGHVEAGPSGGGGPFAAMFEQMFGISGKGKFVEERRCGQILEKGGFYLDPKELPGPGMGDLGFTKDGDG